MGAYKGGDARYNVISMRISDDEEKFFRDLVAAGKFPDRTAALRYFVDAGIQAMEEKGDGK